MSDELFRKEAMSKYLRVDAPGGLVTITPPWTMAIFGTMAALVVALGLFSWFGRAQVTAAGRGIVKPDTPLFVLHAPFTGRVRSVAHGVHSMGRSGEVLVTMNVDTQSVAHDACAADLSRARDELAGLEKRLAEWNEVSAKEREASMALVLIFQIRGEREKVSSLDQKCKALATVLDAKNIAFPADGEVMDVAVAPGSEVREGDVLATIMPASAHLVGYVVLDERHRSELAVGQPVRLKFDALPYDEVGAGNARITRLLDALPSGVKIEGAPTEGVFAELSLDAMPADAGPAHSGMTFNADVLTRRKRILSPLFP